MTVGIFPGVPPLPAGVAVLEAQVSLLVGDAISVLAQVQQQPWGIYDQDSGEALVAGDSVKAVEFINEYSLPNYPQESGSFTSYNKVANPYDLRITFYQGGSVAERESFMAALASRISDLNLYAVYTPEVYYPNANIARFNYRRTVEQGATLLSVEVWLKEIRETATASFSSTATPDGADRSDDGGVAASDVSATSTTATSTTPGLIQSQVANITNGTGNSLPSSASPIGSKITYDGNEGAATGTVQSSSDLGYTLTDGSFVGKNLVTSIVPADAAVIQ